MAKKPPRPSTPGTQAGPAIHLISAEKIEAMGQAEKVRFLLDEVRAGKVLILERGLTPQEEADLIAETMRSVDGDAFIGIELQSYGMDPGRNFVQRLVMGGPRPRMAVIGPANLLKFVSKDNEQIVTRLIGPGQPPAEGAASPPAAAARA
ncbi:MAG TPA: DUF2073 domain-containing protein [Candidatus Thermoplasmatota archaeon]|nr:DUF2073 domain-containing protein [Candidatus Thermoplasmatota archaeon]